VAPLCAQNVHDELCSHGFPVDNTTLDSDLALRWAILICHHFDVEYRQKRYNYDKSRQLAIWDVTYVHCFSDVTART